MSDIARQNTVTESSRTMWNLRQVRVPYSFVIAFSVFGVLIGALVNFLNQPQSKLQETATSADLILAAGAIVGAFVGMLIEIKFRSIDDE